MSTISTCFKSVKYLTRGLEDSPPSVSSRFRSGTSARSTPILIGGAVRPGAGAGPCSFREFLVTMPSGSTGWK